MRPAGPVGRTGWLQGAFALGIRSGKRMTPSGRLAQVSHYTYNVLQERRAVNCRNMKFHVMTSNNQILLEYISNINRALAVYHAGRSRGISSGRRRRVQDECNARSAKSARCLKRGWGRP